MKRLRKTLLSKVINSFKNLRIKRRYIFAEWIPKDPNDPDVIQDVTNVMALGGAMQIRYQDGGVRTIYPYGWNTSKNGDVLIMCYKDDGNVRSYRLDRVQQFIFDDSIIEQDYENMQESSEEVVQNPTLEVNDYGDQEENENSIPSLPPDDTQINVEQPLPYDDAIDIMETSQPEENPMLSQQPQLEVQDYNDINDNSEENEEKSASKKIKRLIRKGDLYEL